MTISTFTIRRLAIYSEETMNSDQSWIDDELETCSVCHDPLCDARCERQVPSQLVFAGLGGLGILALALLIKAWA